MLFKHHFWQRVSSWVLVLAVFAGGLNTQVASAQATPLTQWEVWQTTLTTTQAHAWHAFPVIATFTHTSGATLQVDGYYNGTDASGRHNWQIRFAPNRAGTWTWATQSADASLRASGTLQVTAPTAAQVAANPNLRGHLRVNGRHFTYADGTPFFWLGDTAWFLNSIRAGIGGGEYPNQNFYTWLADRQRRGFTVALTQFFYLASRNEGGYPFTNNTSVPGNGDFSQLNPAFFKALDTRMNALHAGGLVVAAHPSWLSELKLSYADTERIWRYTAARYGAYNMVWSVSGEYQFKYPGTNTWDDASSGGAWSICWRYDTNAPDPNCQFNRLATTVAGYNVYQHPLTIHPAARLGDNDSPPAAWGARAGQQTSGAEFHAQPWLDHNWSQTGHYDSNLFYVYQRTAEDYARTPAKPVIHSEGFYENEKAPGADPYETRWQAWVAYLNGATGHVYGAGGLWQFYLPAAPEPGVAPHDGTLWSTALGYPGANYLQHVGKFLRGLEWWKLQPQRTWVRVNGAAPAAPTASNLTPPHLAAIPGQAVVVYIPRGNAGRTIALTNLGTTSYNARVYNPRFGEWAALNNGAPITPSGGAWTVPAAAYADGDDWVIVLTATSLPLPEPPAAGGFNARLNFQPAGAAAPPGYLADTGLAFGDRGNGLRYGWSADNTANARARNAALSPDVRYDTFNHLQLGGNFTWEIELPNGPYFVRVVAGDAAQYNSVFRINAESVRILEATPTSTIRWIEGAAQVTVTDGRLTLSNASGASANKLAFVEITAIGAAPAPTQTPAPTATQPPPAGSATPTATAPGVAACPAPVSDDFNRADSTSLGANWTERRGDWQMAAAALRNTAASADYLALWNGGSFSDVAVCAQVQFASTATSTISLGARWGNYDSGNLPRQGYNVDIQHNGAVRLMRLQRASTPTVVQLGSTYTIPGFSANTWYTIRLVVQGASLSVEVNGVPRIITTDFAAWPAGQTGVWSDLAAAGNHRFDDWTVQALGGSPAPTATPTQPPATATPTQTAAPTQPPATGTAAPTQPPATSTATPPAGAFTLTVEGEAAAVFNGNARVITKSSASGARAAGYIGTGAAHWVRFNQITVPQTGAYTLTLHYLSAQPRTAYLSINDGPALTLNAPALANWNTVGTVTLTISLNAGDNSLRFFNDTAYAPDIDRLVIQGPVAP